MPIIGLQNTTRTLRSATGGTGSATGGTGAGGRGLLARKSKGRAKGKVKGNKLPTPHKTPQLLKETAIAVIRSHVREVKKLAKQHQLKVIFAFTKSEDGYDDDDDNGYDDDYSDYGR